MFTIDPSVLVDGENVFAVEIHQADGDSSDISFDLELAAVVEGDISEDGFRLQIDGADILLADSQHTGADRLGTVNLSEGSHEIEFVFFESNGDGEVELFAAPGMFQTFADTDTWHLIGDVASGGLGVVTAPDPPTPVEWLRVEPLGTLLFTYADESTVSNAPTVYETDLSAGQVLTGIAAPFTAEGIVTMVVTGNGTTLASTSSPAAGGFTILNNVIIPSSGTYEIEITSDVSTTASIQLFLNTFIEEEFINEIINGGMDNDSIATAEDLDMGSSEISSGIQRSAAVGVISGVQLFEFEFGTLFSPNVLTFDFTDLPAELGAGELFISAVGDLGDGSEFLTVNAENIVVENVFVDDGQDDQSIETFISLSAEQIAALAQDGTISITVQPSAAVGENGGNNSISIFLQIPEASGDHMVVPRPTSVYSRWYSRSTRSRASMLY